MAGTGQYGQQESATHKVTSHIPGTEANRERKLTQGAGVGTGTGAGGYDNTGFDNTQGAGALAGSGAGTGTGYTGAGAGTGYGQGQTTASHTGLAGSDYAGTGHHHHAAGTGAGVTGAGAGGLVSDATPGRIGEHGHTGTHTGTTTGHSTHTGTHTSSTNTSTAGDGEKQSLGTKIKKVIPGTEEHKLHKEGVL